MRLLLFMYYSLLTHFFFNLLLKTIQLSMPFCLLFLLELLLIMSVVLEKCALKKYPFGLSIEFVDFIQPFFHNSVSWWQMKTNLQKWMNRIFRIKAFQEVKIPKHIFVFTTKSLKHRLSWRRYHNCSISGLFC